MNAPATILTPRKLSETERAALVNLLTDDDPAVYRAIRDKILSAGPDAGEWLRPHLLSDDPVLRRRAREIIRHFGRQAADTRFLAFCLRHGEEFDLEEGVWLLAQTEYPEVNGEAYRALLDNYAGELRERTASKTGHDQVLAAINDYLFGELGFAGNEENYYDPESSYLNRVIDRRTGNPINLCLLYLLIGRRLHLPVTGIGLPGHFVCRCQSSAEEIYLDPFNRGQFLTKADCVQYLLRGKYSLREDFLSPVSARRMLMRVCGNLHKIYRHLERAEEAGRIQHYLVALAR
jgi:regulator of sirC expression with transglutaminase-like and TPR domain